MCADVAVPVVMVAGDVAGRAVIDRARLAAEDVPDGKLFAVGVMSSFDLVGARRDAEDEAAWETTSRDDRVVRTRIHRRVVHTVTSLHFSTPVMTTPRMNARCAKKKIAIGTTMAMTAAAWMSVGFCEYSALKAAMPTESGCASMLPCR